MLVLRKYGMLIFAQSRSIMPALPQVPATAVSSSRGLTWMLVYSAVVAALGGLLFGFDTAVISGAEKTLKEVFGLNSFWHGFTVSTALIGTIVGSVLVEYPADGWGRKKTLFLLAVLYFGSSVGCAVAPGWLFFVVARFIGGLAIGGASVVAPMYIAEISPAHLRGRLVALNQLNIVLGILVSFVSNYFIAQHWGPEEAWRWMLGVVAAPSLLFFVLLFVICESPRWLVKVGREEEARQVLSKLGEVNAADEVRLIQESLNDGGTGAKERLWQRRYARPIFLAWAIAMFNQLSGINALMYYAPRIFELAGAKEGAALLQSVAVGGTNLIFTVAAMFVIDRFGRRTLMFAGSIGYIVSLTSTALAFHHYGQHFDSTGSTVVLVSLLLFIASHAFGQGAVIWVFIGEIFPNAVRAKGQALGSFTHWFMAAAVGWAFPMIAEQSGAGAFAFFAAMMVLQLVFVIRWMPETKGASLEEVGL